MLWKAVQTTESVSNRFLETINYEVVKMKIYYVTRTFKLPVSILCCGEEELERVKACNPSQFTDYWFERADGDEREEVLFSCELEQLGSQTVEVASEDDEVSE